MNPNPRAWPVAMLLTAALFLLAACNSSSFRPPEVQGRPALVDDAGQPRLWTLSKQEETRQVGVGGGGMHNTMSWRSDTFFNFDLRAYDPVAAKPLWNKRLLSIGDPDARGPRPSRVIGSDVDAQLLGQDGGLVWLLIGDAPYAVNASDGGIVVDSEALQRINPELKGLLPSEAKHYGFDHGLVLMSADARRFVIRGNEHKAIPYTPPPPAPEVEGPLRANGTHELVPLMPLGEIAARQVTLAGQWLGLYSEAEAKQVGDDSWGRNLRWPYSVFNEGALARRTFWHAKIIEARNFDDSFQRLSDLTPVAGAPTFLKGRFVNDRRTGEPLLLDDPVGVLVWHSTRIDDAGRLALTRLDAQLQPVWKTALPLSETDTIRPVSYWQLPGHIAIVGDEQVEDAGVTRREPRLVSIDIKTGVMHAWDLERDQPIP